jgi:Group XII secretory phospholipase A2 precursor (PLA2G12)
LFVKTATASLALGLAALKFGLTEAFAQSGCVCQPPPINVHTCLHRYDWPFADRTPNGCGSKGGWASLFHLPDAPFGIKIGTCCDRHDIDWSNCRKDETESNNDLWWCLSNLAPDPGDNAAVYILVMGLAATLVRGVSSGPGHSHYIDVQNKSCYCAPCGSVMCAHANPFPPWSGVFVDYPEFGGGGVDIGPGGTPIPGDDFPGGQ